MRKWAFLAAMALVGCASDQTMTTASAPAGDCAGLTSAKIKDGKVDAASMVAATTDMPAYCKVQLTLKPEPGSNIKVEVWLPEKGKWNGKFLGTGNGGAAGRIRTDALQTGLARGYAVANTDMGTSSGIGGLNYGFGTGNPTLQKDFSYRATDGMTLEGKKVTVAYYGQQPKFSYFQGCSTGGFQSMEQVHRLPAEYDGVIAGAPANNRPDLHVVRLWMQWLNLKTPQATVPKEKLALVQRAATAQCDALDGVNDGIIADPRTCTFNTASLTCQGPERADCLTAEQVKTVQAINDGPRNPRTGALIYPGYERGSEAGIELYWNAPVGPGGAVSTKETLVTWSPKFQSRHGEFFGFDFDGDLAAAKADLDGILNYTDPKLAGFQKAGGKLLLYHGWADSLIPARGTPNYYEKIAAANGGFAKTQGFARLFMLPGVAHCRGGVGPDQFDMLTALENWVERGQAPASVLATRPAKPGLPALSRPLCPYPAAARYKGQGDPNDAANFTCQAPTA